MARVFQGIRLKRAKSTAAKYKVTYTKVVNAEVRNVNGVPTKYSYTTYKKVITPKKLSYM